MQSPTNKKIAFHLKYKFYFRSSELICAHNEIQTVLQINKRCNMDENWILK